jgi:putative SOS response-associated peptidase YedK
MCNEAARRIALGQLRDDWSQLKVPLVFPEGLPNLGVQDSIRITDTALILRAAPDSSGSPQDTALRGGSIAGTTRRWSWPGQGGRPVYNYRSEGRPFANTATSGRCLIPVDGFFEFTAPPAGAHKSTKKTKWRFAAPPGSPIAIGHAEPWFCIAGFWRADAAVGEAWTMLTGEPGPDVAPYHYRQVMLPRREHWAGWLDGSLPANEVLGPAAAGSLVALQV